LWPALCHLEQRISCLSSTDSLFTFDLFNVSVSLDPFAWHTERAFYHPLFFHIMTL
jgi:hypothetical protein